MLHALINHGEAEMLAGMCDTTSEWCAPRLQAINTYYGRPTIPVGTLKGAGASGTAPDWDGETYNKFIAANYPNVLKNGRNAPDAVKLYREILSPAKDKSVVIVAVGSLTNLRNLSISQPDENSKMTGAELVSQKVKLLSVMGGRYPCGKPEANFAYIPPASKKVIEEWPTPIMFSGSEIGETIKTGSRLLTEAEPDNPVRVAYRRWDAHFVPQWNKAFDTEHHIYPHNSYDQTALLYAVRGLRDYWKAGTKGANQISPTAQAHGVRVESAAGVTAI